MNSVTSSKRARVSSPSPIGEVIPTRKKAYRIAFIIKSLVYRFS